MTLTEEQRFLSVVRQLRHIGYGRMMQIIEREWYRDAVAHGESTSGVLVVCTALGLMSPENLADFVAGYEADPLFGRSPGEPLGAAREE